MRSRHSVRARAVLAGAAVLSALVVEARVWHWPWTHAFVSWLGTHVVSVIAAIVVGLVLLPSLIREKVAPVDRSNATAGDSARWPWLLSDSGLLTVVGTLAGIGMAALMVMLEVSDDLAAGPDRAKLQIEAIKYGLGSIAAGGAAAALLLAVRRQRHTEQIHAHTVEDAAEKRVTELYTKAVEQLGSADAAVRLGGLYALERVAENNVSQRQTVVNVLCAYLRMPYRPSSSRGPDSIGALLPAQPSRQKPPSEIVTPAERDPAQELQVRLAAQRILAAHCRRDDGGPLVTPQPWGNVQLDLSGAVLVKMILRDASLRQATFSDAIFVGNADFTGTEFTDGVSFVRAEFRASTEFGRATFDGKTLFDNTAFGDATDFTDCKFTGAASFKAARFRGRARFREAVLTEASFVSTRFEESVQFGGAVFSGRAIFSGTDFEQEARFGEAMFAKCKFLNARFKGEAWFGRTSFADSADFGGTIFSDSAHFIESRFAKDAKFGETRFQSETSFARSTFERLANFGASSFAAGTFTGARFGGRAWFVAANFAEVGVFDGATFLGDCRFTKDFPGDVVRFINARVLARPDRKDEWPEGWQAQHRVPGDDEDFLVLRRASAAEPVAGDIIDI
ncbi:pentapeptide repeat-containing protein [Actinoplanes sp. DH11]|uniref:pentapeptide repeat-containing protein n=1 Tax=Actinoplanes sp. DH11 TaxID=2857011 RepID=UPI001E5D8E4C|nr:pentapeptide repeat-containing protein [Actinoplanes sp. DH11]